MTLAPNARCWIVTEGLVGLQNQAIGLAEALGLSYELKTAGKPGLPWKLLPPGYWPDPLALSALAAPWPDVLITCGRAGVAAALAVKKASKNACFTIHIQNPLINPAYFDAVIAPEHDRLQGANVLSTFGAIHRVNAQKLAEAKAHFLPKFAALPRPLIGVLIGGKSRHQEFALSAMQDLGRKLKAFAATTGGGLLVTPSRRTGAENEAELRAILKNTPAYIWDGTGENPYFGLLAASDAIVVTSDSISMISEACFTGKPVYVHELPGGSRRFTPFLQELARRGMTRAFSGEIVQNGLSAAHYTPLDETRRAADFVRARYAARRAAA
jgi:mitochondrial fission protein ELM1